MEGVARTQVIWAGSNCLILYIQFLTIPSGDPPGISSRHGLSDKKYRCSKQDWSTWSCEKTGHEVLMLRMMMTMMMTMMMMMTTWTMASRTNGQPGASVHF